jgi:RNA methyltransferase, TrmH family
MPRETITSFQNNKIKLASKLTSKRHREKNGLFLIDYARDLERALDFGYQVAFAFYCEQIATDDDHAVLARLHDTLVYDVDADLIAKASYRQNPTGLVAVLRQKAIKGAADAETIGSGHVLMLVNLRKPGNIGALLRTADAAAIQHVVLVDTALDIYNPNIIRSSTGACFLDHIYAMTTAEALSICRQNDIAILAAHLDGQQSLYEWDFNAQTSAIVLGTEDKGLEDIWVNNCDSLVKIPMAGSLSDSLNVSVSGAICMYEALRQQQYANDNQ